MHCMRSDLGNVKKLLKNVNGITNTNSMHLIPNFPLKLLVILSDLIQVWRDFASQVMIKINTGRPRF